MKRRDFLCRSAGTLAVTALPVHRALAAASGTGNRRKFIFVVNYGGWDPTRVFATEFGNVAVDMERSSQIASVGDLTYVDNALRPAVSTFFERYASRSLIFNGILSPSVAHENCLRWMMTGSTRQDGSDWGAIAAGVVGTSYPLPQVIAAGPSFPGNFGAYVTRTGTSGQLAAMLDRSIIGWSDQTTRAPSVRGEALMDAYMQRRVDAYAAAANAGSQAAQSIAYQGALDRAATLKGLGSVVDWSASASFQEQANFAVDLLSLGVTRCVTTQFDYLGWDSHINNDVTQSTNFEMLFQGLLDLFDALKALPGETEETLLDETVVVVLSEMGRTPQLNAGAGKDHWPYTSAMVVGPGVTGGRVIGGLDSYYYGKNIDLETGEIDEENGESLSADVFGATLLTVAGVDSEEYLAGVGVVTGALSEG